MATLRAVPKRFTTMPARGIATIAPRAMASRTSPSSDGVACSSSRIWGMREPQLAKQNPLPMKAT